MPDKSGGGNNTRDTGQRAMVSQSEICESRLTRQLAMDGQVRWILCHETRTWSGVASHRSGQRMIATSRKRLFRLQRIVLFKILAPNTEDCHQERDSTKGHCVGQRDLVR